MKRRPSLAVLAIACLTAPGTAFGQVRQIPLAERIQATFRATDLDKNGTVSPQEAAKAGVPARSFAAYDKNKDRRLASDEFSAYYQKLIERRAERARKAKEAKQKQEAAKRKALEDAKKKPGVKAPAVGAEKTLGKTPASTPANTPAREAAKEAQKPIPVAQQPKVEPAKTDGQTPGSTEPAVAKNVAKAKDAGAPGVDAKKQGTPKPEPELTPVQLIQTEQRARTYVQRLLAKGHVTVPEASDLYQSLSVQVPAPTAPNQIALWREALNQSRDRVTGLVRGGSLTAAEGREMYQLFEVRARRAVAGANPQTRAPRGTRGLDPAGKSPKQSPQNGTADVGKPKGEPGTPDDAASKAGAQKDVVKDAPAKPAPVSQDSQTPKVSNPGSTADGDSQPTGMTPAEKAAPRPPACGQCTGCAAYKRGSPKAARGRTSQEEGRYPRGCSPSEPGTQGTTSPEERRWWQRRRQPRRS